MLKIATVAASVACMFVFAGCASMGPGGEAHSAAAHGDHAGCACKSGTEGKTFWCDHCGAGYVDGEKVKCKGCYDAKTGGKPCTGCAK